MSGSELDKWERIGSEFGLMGVNENERQSVGGNVNDWK